MPRLKRFVVGVAIAGWAGCPGAKTDDPGRASVRSAGRAETAAPPDLAGLGASLPVQEPGTEPRVATILGRRFAFKQLTGVVEGRVSHSLQISGDDVVMSLGDWTATTYAIDGATVTFGPYVLRITGEPRHYTVNGHAVELGPYGWFTFNEDGQVVRLH